MKNKYTNETIRRGVKDQNAYRLFMKGDTVTESASPHMTTTKNIKNKI